MKQHERRVVVTGMSINTPIGNDLDTFYENLVAGKSAVSNWKFFENEAIYSKVGGDLTDFDVKAKLAALKSKLSDRMHTTVRKLSKKAPFSTPISMLCAADAFADAGLEDGQGDPTRNAVIIGGHNINERYLLKEYDTFLEEPDYIDSLIPLLNLDTNHAGSVTEVLGWSGAAYTMGGACASSNVALRSAIDEIRHHDNDLVMLIGPVVDYSVAGLHGMALMGAIAIESFNDEPTRASRPYDSRREGFIPSHGAAGLVLEELDHALARGARIYAEVLGCSAGSDGSHLPSPGQGGQVRALQRLLRRCDVKPEQVDFICAHATSTPLGDITEINSIKEVFGKHAYRVKINAPKSMLGHTCWSAAAVETVAALLQMQNNRLHPSINIDSMDPAIDLDVCANEAVDHEINVILKNSFGFGGINCCALYRRFDPASV